MKNEIDHGDVLHEMTCLSIMYLPLPPIHQIHGEEKWERGIFLTRTKVVDIKGILKRIVWIARSIFYYEHQGIHVVEFFFSYSFFAAAANRVTCETCILNYWKFNFSAWRRHVCLLLMLNCMLYANWVTEHKCQFDIQLAVAPDVHNQYLWCCDATTLHIFFTHTHTPHRERLFDSVIILCFAHTHLYQGKGMYYYQGKAKYSLEYLGIFLI